MFVHEFFLGGLDMNTLQATLNGDDILILVNCWQGWYLEFLI